MGDLSFITRYSFIKSRPTQYTRALTPNSLTCVVDVYESYTTVSVVHTVMGVLHKWSNLSDQDASDAVGKVRDKYGFREVAGDDLLR